MFINHTKINKPCRHQKTQKKKATSHFFRKFLALGGSLALAFSVAKGNLGAEPHTPTNTSHSSFNITVDSSSSSYKNSQSRPFTVKLSGEKIIVSDCNKDTTLNLAPTLIAKFGYVEFPSETKILEFHFSSGALNYYIFAPESESVISIYKIPSTGSYTYDYVGASTLHQNPVFLKVESGPLEGLFVLTQTQILFCSRVQDYEISPGLVAKYGPMQNPTINLINDSGGEQFVRVACSNWPMVLDLNPQPNGSVKWKFSDKP